MSEQPAEPVREDSPRLTITQAVTYKIPLDLLIKMLGISIPDEATVEIGHMHPGSYNQRVKEIPGTHLIIISVLQQDAEQEDGPG